VNNEYPSRMQARCLQTTMISLSTPSPEETEQEPRTPIDIGEQELLDMWDEGTSPPIDIEEDQLDIKVFYETTEVLFKIKPEYIGLIT